jgi:hypothetical protein
MITLKMPIKLIKNEPVAMPTMVMSTPNNTSIGDNADAYNFKNHKNGAGQCKGLKNKRLVSAVKIPRRTASD